MPLVQNSHYIYKKYNTTKTGCTTYFKATEDEIFCMVLDNQETKGMNPAKIARSLYEKGPVKGYVKGHFIGKNLTDFDKWLAVHFKLK